LFGFSDLLLISPPHRSAAADVASPPPQPARNPASLAAEAPAAFSIDDDPAAATAAPAPAPVTAAAPPPEPAEATADDAPARAPAAALREFAERFMIPEAEAAKAAFRQLIGDLRAAAGQQ